MHDRFKWLWGYWRVYKGRLTVVLALTIVSIAARTAYPLMFKFIIDALTGTVHTQDAKHIALWVLGVGIFQQLMLLLLPNSRAWMNETFTMLFRERLFEKILRKGYAFFLKFRSGDLITRMTDDIEGNVDKLGWYSCSGVFRPIEAILILVFSLGVMFYLHWKLTLLSFLPIPLLVWLLAKTESAVETRSQQRQKAVSKVNDVLESCFAGIRIVKSYAGEKAQEKLLDDALTHRVGTEVSLLRLRSLLDMVGQLVTYSGVLVVLFVGGIFVIRKEMTLGDFFAFTTYFSQLVGPIWTIGWFFVSTKIVFVSVDRHREVEDFPDRVDLVSDSPRADIVRIDSLTAENLRFSYVPESGRENLSGISLELHRPEVVAIVGAIGSGKSTLLEAVLGELELSGGRVSYNGRPIWELDRRDLLARIGYVPQESLLFSESIEENITLGRPWPDPAALERAIATAQLEKDLAGFPEGAAQVLGQRGISISGGQKQRVAIARALFPVPDLLLLDDCTAALDAATEEAFWDALRRNYPQTACLVVTHREATSRQADRVILLESGRMIGSGTHLELLSSPKYQAFTANGH